MTEKPDKPRPPTTASSPDRSRAVPEPHGAVADVVETRGELRAYPLDPRARYGSYGDIVDEWGRQSFPASDPPANW